VGARSRRRRPTGAPPPLPRSIGASGKVWLGALAVLLAWMIVVLRSPWALQVTDQIDSALLRQVAHLRTGWLTDAMRAVDRIPSGWALTIVTIALIALQMVFRRWRQLFTFIASLAVLEIVASIVYEAFSRPRPYGVTTIGRWAGFSMPSPPVVVTAAVLIGVTYTLVVPGHPRRIAKFIAGGLLALVAFARLYLGIDHPSDVLVGVVLGVAIPLNAFRVFTPNEVFPVAYGQGKTAHLDVGGKRGAAIRQAVHDQLGLTVVDLQPVGLEGSGGSTPLRLRIAGDPETSLFAKLYAMNHVRADRWYKLGRTILYGRLEDETPFQSVRRLVEYEDYALRLLRDVGLPTAAPYGIVEITPGREYLLVTEFFDGAEEIGEADIDEGVIDDGLRLIRRLWDAGLAHRDIKPANLLVRDGRVLVVDVAFVQIRPSPWRQAVDLANMMLVLAVRSDSETVYLRALSFFTTHEIAEAFAAARGVASPSQLRTAMKQDGRDLLSEFRLHAPERRPIALQRWSVRRVALAFALVAGTAIAVLQTVALVTPVYDIGVDDSSVVSGAFDTSPTCGTGKVMVLIAQSVPSATLVPCIGALPAGWTTAGASIRRNRTTFWLDSDRAGDRAVTATLRPQDACDVTGATSVPSDEVGARRFERPANLPPRLHSTRYYLFPGGCATYELSFDEGAPASLIFETDQLLTLERRSQLVAEVRSESDLRLCGVGADCPGGGER